MVESPYMKDHHRTVDFDIASARTQWRKRENRRRAEREQRREVIFSASITILQTVLPRYPSIRRAYLFGSVTEEGAFYPHSDVDVAVDDASPGDYWAAWREIERALPDYLAVDFRVLSDDLEFAAHVESIGVLVYEPEVASIESHS